MSLSADAPEADLFDVVTAPATVGAGEDAVTVELPAADATALAALAARLGLGAEAIWRAGWALLLARLIGVSRVRIGGSAGTAAAIDVPTAGELSPWLSAVAAADPVAVASSDLAPQTAWDAGERAPAADSDAGPALIWRVRGGTGTPGAVAGAPAGGAAVARFAGARIDRATVERIGALLGTVMAGLVAPGARLETVSPLTEAERARVVRTGTRPGPNIAPRPRSTACSASRPPRTPSASRSSGTAGG